MPPRSERVPRQQDPLVRHQEHRVRLLPIGQDEAVKDGGFHQLHHVQVFPRPDLPD